MKRYLLLGFALLVTCSSAWAQFNFTSLDHDGYRLMTAKGINNAGDIVGAYSIRPPRHALLIQNGNYIPLLPDTILGRNFSVAQKINNHGDIAGNYTDDSGIGHSYLLSGGVFTTLEDFPGASDTVAQGINDAGTIVGYWDKIDASGNFVEVHGLIWKNGNLSQVDVPGATDTALLGINNRGDIVGEWDNDVNSPVFHAFISPGHGSERSERDDADDAAGGDRKFISFDFPGAVGTQANDINDHRLIVGVYTDANGASHGFVGRGRKLTGIDVPGSVAGATMPLETNIWGINLAGQIVGNYRITNDGLPHGFVATPALQPDAEDNDEGDD